MFKQQYATGYVHKKMRKFYMFQVKEYLMCQWNYKIENWDEFSFTEWILLSAFLSPLLNLNINVRTHLFTSFKYKFALSGLYAYSI